MSNNTPVALVTGAARRIGAAIGRCLHQHGYNLVIHYHRSEIEAMALVAELNQLRADSALAVKADLNHVDQIKRLGEEASQHWGRLDLLVNNASQYFSTLVGKTTQTEWQNLMNSNLMAPYFLTQAVLPALEKQEGTIINIIDIHGQKPLKNYVVYSTAKAGLTMLTKALAKELGPKVRVNGVAPGPTLWPEGKNSIDEALQAKLIAKTALKRQCEAGEIAETVLFLATQRFLTGQIINVDSGRVLSV